MKSIRNLLAALAFVFAFGAAFALSANNSTMSLEFGNFSSGCALGTINEPNCGTTITDFGRCTVTSGSETVVAWDERNVQSACINALYKQSE